CRDFGLTSRCSSSPVSSRLAISGITRVQNQWAPEGWSGFSVRRLIATRMRSTRFRAATIYRIPALGSEYVRRDRSRCHPRLADVLGQGMHDRLGQVLDHAVVRAMDVNGHLGAPPGLSPVEAGRRERAQAMAASPFERPDDVGRAAGGGDGDERVTGPGLGLKLIGEHV